MKTPLALNEVFRSFQGEGAMAGTGAIFVRFAGCNLACKFCDTDYAPKIYRSSAELAGMVDKLSADGVSPAGYVVMTGGEPAIQLCTDEGKSLIDILKTNGFRLAIETNGTVPGVAQLGLDWITVSPKILNFPDWKLWKLRTGDELKVVYAGQDLRPYDQALEEGWFDHCFLQPEDGLDQARNQRICVREVIADPRWKLSLQLHKIVGVL